MATIRYGQFCVAGCVIRQPTRLIKTLEQNTTKKDTKSETRQDSSEDNTVSEERSEIRPSRCEKLDLRFSLFQNRIFSMYVIAIVFCTFGHVNNTILIPSHVKELGYDNRYVALSVSITGGFEIIARIFIGWLADLKIVRTKYIFVVCMCIGGIFSLIFPLFDSFTFMAIYAAGQFTFPGSCIALIPVLAIEAVGMDDFSEAFGLILLSMAVASSICQPISGWMYDYFGSWHSSFILTGTTFICAGVTVLLEPVIVRRCQKQKYIVSDVEFEITAPEEDQRVKGIQTQTQDYSCFPVGDDASLGQTSDMNVNPAFRNDDK